MIVDEKKVPSTAEASTDLAELANNDILKSQSAEILSAIVKEKDPDKTADLTKLFNENHRKKSMLQISKLYEVSDDAINLIANRIHDHPDEVSTEDGLKILKAAQDAIDKRHKYVDGIVEQGPLIEVHHEQTEITVGDTDINKLPKTSRDNIAKALAMLMGKPAPVDENIIDVTVNTEEGDK